MSEIKTFYPETKIRLAVDAPTLEEAERYARCFLQVASFLLGKEGFFDDRFHDETGLAYMGTEPVVEVTTISSETDHV